MLWIWTARVKDGKEKEYKKWVLNNMKLIEKNMPSGWTHLGTYGGSLDPSEVCCIWEFKKFADIDRMMELENAVSDRLSSEENAFLVPGTSKVTLLNVAENWFISAPRKPKKK